MPTISVNFAGAVAINDLSTLNQVFAVNAVPLNAVITEIRVNGLNITHTFDGDLDISLIDPDGNIVDLSSDNGGSGDNYTNTSFFDAAATLITTGAAPFSGNFRPEQALSALYAGAINGNWTLRITDDAGGDTGTLLGASLVINYDLLPVIWTAGVSNNWNTIGNWNFAVVPTINDDVQVAAPANATNPVSINGDNASAKSLLINNNASLNITSGSLTVANALNIAAGTVDVSGAGAFVSAGTLNLAAAASSQLIVRNGATVGSGAAGATLLGTVTAGSGANNGTITIGGAGLAAEAAGTLNAAVLGLATAGSQLVFHTTDTATFSGVITGAGSVSQNSAGQTAILTGNNSYSGLTTISAGTLQLGNGSATGDVGAGAIVNNGTLRYNHSIGSYFHNNVVSGSGNVVIASSGAEYLTQDNTYTGGTTITSGSLLIGNNGTTGSLGTGDIVNNGSLYSNRSDNFVMTNTISGNGLFAKFRAGTLTLTANSSMSGTLRIDAGTVQFGNGGTTGNIGSAAILNNGTLALNHSDGNYANYNLISGNGAVVVNGTFNTFEYFVADNTYSGGTTINSGVAVIGGGGNTGSLGTGDVVNHGSLDYGRTNDMTLANNISGTGVAAKI